MEGKEHFGGFEFVEEKKEDEDEEHEDPLCSLIQVDSIAFCPRPMNFAHFQLKDCLKIHPSQDSIFTIGHEKLSLKQIVLDNDEATDFNVVSDSAFLQSRIICFDVCGPVLAVGLYFGDLLLYDIKKKTKFHEEKIHNNLFTSIHMHRRGSDIILVSTSNDANITIWKISTSEKLSMDFVTKIHCSTEINCAYFSPKFDRLLASGDYCQEFFVWEIEGHLEEGEYHSNFIKTEEVITSITCCWVSNHQAAYGLEDGWLLVWDVGTHTRVYEHKFMGPIRKVQAIPGANILVAQETRSRLHFIDTKVWGNPQSIIFSRGEEVGFDILHGKYILAGFETGILKIPWVGANKLVDIVLRYLQLNKQKHDWNLELLPSELQERTKQPTSIRMSDKELHQRTITLQQLFAENTASEFDDYPY